VTGGRDIFVSEETVPFNAVETRSRKKKQDEADKKIDETLAGFCFQSHIHSIIVVIPVTHKFIIHLQKKIR
jgi:hypothetical protein